MEVRQNFSKLAKSPVFSDERIWLTAYIAGSPRQLAKLGGKLSALRWTNLEGSEGGFIYPKIKVPNTAENVIEIAINLMHLVAEYGVEFLHLDVDTDTDPNKSQFFTILKMSA